MLSSMRISDGLTVTLDTLFYDQWILCFVLDEPRCVSSVMSLVLDSRGLRQIPAVSINDVYKHQGESGSMVRK
jgi:hypothetical protein